MARGRRGGEHDNRATVTEIAALRAERAGLLGFGSHAEYMIADETIGSVAAVIELLTRSAPPPRPRPGSKPSATPRRCTPTDTTARWSRGTGPTTPPGSAGPATPSTRPRLQQYLVLDRVLEDGLFGVAGALYGLTVRTPPRPARRRDPDVSVWAVTDEDGTDRGLLYVDPFARDGKQGGAWMDAYAEPAPLLGRRPLVFLTLNAERPADGAPALLTPLDVRILFHEFGHGLHMLLSDVAYPRVAGINVAHDVVEFPSKLHESLAWRPDVVARYARHHVTGEPLAAAEVAALNAFVRDGAPYISTQGAANALLDQAWHGLAPGETVAPDAVDAFEAAVLERHGLVVPGVGFHYHSTFFTHVFDGHYPGTQYSYLWSAALEAITLQWLDEQGGLTRANGQRLREAVLARGAVVDPIAAIAALTGRRPSVGPLLERRGLARPGPGRAVRRARQKSSGPTGRDPRKLW